MSHDSPAIDYYVHPVTGARSITGNRNFAGESRVTVHAVDVDYTSVSEITHHVGAEQFPARSITFYFGDRHSIGIVCTPEELPQILGFFYGAGVTVDANGVVTPGQTTTPDPDTPPVLQLVQDPVIYNRPETGLSQKNIPFFKFHNPNGKSAITISMTDVDHTRFDSNSDDTHYYVVVTKARIEIRCLCTVNEQLGLEFRFRGTTHVISAEESNNVRRIAESRANPE